MTPQELLAAQEEERQLLTQQGAPADVLPTPELPAEAAATPQPASPPPVPANHPQAYGTGADEAALADALHARDQADITAKFQDASTSFNKAFGGTLGDQAAATRAHRDDALKDFTQHRQASDQDLARGKAVHDAAMAEALKLGNSPESLKIKDAFGATTVGASLKQKMGEDAWARLPGEAIPGAKEQLASETALLKESNKAAGKHASPGALAAVQALATDLERAYPKDFPAIKDQFLAIDDPSKAQAVANYFQRQHTPALRAGFAPDTAEPYAYDRKGSREDILSALRGTGPGASSAPPLPTSIDVKEPSGALALPPAAKAAGMPAPGPGETRKDFMRRKDALRSAGAPSKGWAFDDEVLAGTVSPPAKKELDKAREYTESAATALDYGAQLQEFLAKHPDGSFAGLDATRARKYQAALQSMVRGANNMGVFRPGEQPMIDRMVSNPTTIPGVLKSLFGVEDARTALNTLMEEMQQRAWTANEQAHVHPTAENARWAGFKPKMGGGASSAAPGGPSGQGRQIVKKFINRAIGKTKLVYSDGSEEVVDGAQ